MSNTFTQELSAIYAPLTEKDSTKKAHINQFLQHIVSNINRQKVIDRAAEKIVLMNLQERLLHTDKEAKERRLLLANFFTNNLGRDPGLAKTGQNTYIYLSSFIDEYILSISDTIEELRQFMSSVNQDMDKILKDNPDLDMVLFAKNVLVILDLIENKPEIKSTLFNINHQYQQATSAEEKEKHRQNIIDKLESEVGPTTHMSGFEATVDALFLNDNPDDMLKQLQQGKSFFEKIAAEYDNATMPSEDLPQEAKGTLQEAKGTLQKAMNPSQDKNSTQAPPEEGREHDKKDKEPSAIAETPFGPKNTPHS